MKIEKLFVRLDRRPDCKRLKSPGQYLALRDKEGVSLYHYGVLLGKVRRTPEGYIGVLGHPETHWEVCSLNKMWEYYGVKRRVCKIGGEIQVIPLRMKLLS